MKEKIKQFFNRRKVEAHLKELIEEAVKHHQMTVSDEDIFSELVRLGYCNKESKFDLVQIQELLINELFIVRADLYGPIQCCLHQLANCYDGVHVRADAMHLSAKIEEERMFIRVLAVPKLSMFSHHFSEQNLKSLNKQVVKIVNQNSNEKLPMYL